jgi:hypothetical protein
MVWVFLTFLLIGCKEPVSGDPRPRRPHVVSETSTGWKNISKVILIVFENTDYEYAIAQPYMSKIIEKGALLTSYYGLIRQSQPNYFAMVAGDTFGASNDNITLKKRHFGDALEEKGKTWKNYAEGYPGNCFLGSRSGYYVRRHTPFISFENVQKNPERCARVVNADEFQKDFNAHTLPHFSFYTPDLLNDGHDTGMTYGDRWLAGFLDPILNDAETMKDTLIIITFDEAAVGGANGNRLLTLFIGADVIPGAKSNQDYDHYCLLRTLEAIFGITPFGKYDSSSPVIDDIWRKVTPT